MAPVDDDDDDDGDDDDDEGDDDDDDDDNLQGHTDLRRNAMISFGIHSQQGDICIFSLKKHGLISAVSQRGFNSQKSASKRENI